MTKKYKNKLNFVRLLSFTLTILPVILYSILGFYNGSIGEKVSLGICTLLAIMFVIINVMFKYHIRSTLWIMLIGIYICIDNIIPLLITMAASTIIDEFVLVPLIKKYKDKYIINKEIDLRGKNE
jgi:ABC-type proline/glycine betaine transport system permease subunit